MRTLSEELSAFLKWLDLDGEDPDALLREYLAGGTGIVVREEFEVRAVRTAVRSLLKKRERDYANPRRTEQRKRILAERRRAELPAADAEDAYLRTLRTLSAALDGKTITG